METTIVKLDTLRCVGIRHVGPYHEIGSKFGQIIQWGMSNGIRFEQTLGIYHDDPNTVPPAELKSDACLILEPGTNLPSLEGTDYAEIVIEAGEFAKATHFGPYDGLFAAWTEFMGPGIASTGRMPDCLTFEIYVNDCSVVPEDQLQTDLYCRVK